MIRRPIVALLSTAALPVALRAQRAEASRDSAAASDIARIEHRIEAATAGATVGDSAFLDSVYAPGFRFKHATGQLQTRAQVLAVVRRARFAARDLDSLDVEVHGDMALSTGRIHVRRRPGAPPALASGYTLRYVRVYVYRDGRWRLLTHHSTGEVADSSP